MGKNSLFLSPQIHSFLFSFKEMRTLRELSHQTLGAKWGEGGGGVPGSAHQKEEVLL